MLRLGGPNFHQIPVNAPKCPFANHQRDGHMQMQVPKGRVAYDPSSLQEDTPRETPAGFRSHASADDGRKGRTRAESFADHYSQARMFFRSLEKPEQAHLASALVFELSKVETLKVRVRTVSHLRNIDDSLAQRVANGLALPALPDPAPTATPVRDMPPAPEVRVIGRNKPTLQGRCIGILFDEGSDARIIASLSKAARKSGADVKLVAPRVGGATLSDGALQAADGQLAGTPSAVFDAVAVVLSPEAAKALSKESAAIEFVSQAWAHLKAIASDAGGQTLLKAARVGNDAGIVEAEDAKAFLAAAATRQWAREPAAPAGLTTTTGELSCPVVTNPHTPINRSARPSTSRKASASAVPAKARPSALPGRP